MIEDLIQEIHTCRDLASLDNYYNEVVDNFYAGYFSENMAKKAIREINHRRYSDFNIKINKSDSFSSYDSDAVEFFSRASVTSAAAKNRVNQFVKGLKHLGLWEHIICVTCHSDMGGLHQIGGSQYKTNTPWTITGNNVLSEDGIVGTGYTSGSNAIPNALIPQQTFSTASIVSNPVLLLGSFSQNYQNTASQGRIYGASGPSGTLRNYTIFGGYSSTDSDGDSIAGVSSYGTGRVTYSSPKILRDRNRPFLFGSWLHGSGSTSINIVNNRYDSGTTSGANTVHTNFAFGNGATATGEGRIHFAALAFCNPNNSGGKVSWQRLWALINSTLFSHKRSRGNLRIQISGQSNASSQLATYLNRDNLCDNGERCSEVYQANIGGVAITEWLGTGTPTRTASYQSNFWKGDGTGTLEQARPINDIGVWHEYILWFQGESDSETDDLTNNYKSRLQSLINFWREDTGNKELKVIIVKIGYHYSYRCNTSIGNFSLSSPLSVLNGTWVIQTLSTATENYSWKYNGYTLKRQNNRWEFIKDSDSSIIGYSRQNPEHPELVSQWIIQSNKETLSFTSSRLGRIEKIRSVQQEVKDSDPYALIIDARNFEYNAADTAHLTTNGQIALAEYIASIV